MALWVMALPSQRDARKAKELFSSCVAFLLNHEGAREVGSHMSSTSFSESESETTSESSLSDQTLDSDASEAARAFVQNAQAFRDFRGRLQAASQQRRAPPTRAVPDSAISKDTKLNAPGLTGIQKTRIKALRAEPM